MDLEERERKLKEEAKKLEGEKTSLLNRIKEFELREK